MIYYDSYRIDSKGKQIYEPKVSASSGAVIYSGDKYADSAFEKLRLNLTLEEIYGLSVYGRDKTAIIAKTRDFLDPAEIAAIQMMSYDELYAAYTALVYAAETYGAGGTDNEPEQGVYSEGGGADGDTSGGDKGEGTPPAAEDNEYPPMTEDDTDDVDVK